jgi:hypothetical protein
MHGDPRLPPNTISRNVVPVPLVTLDCIGQRIKRSGAIQGILDGTLPVFGRQPYRRPCLLLEPIPPPLKLPRQDNDFIAELLAPAFVLDRIFLGLTTLELSTKAS